MQQSVKALPATCNNIQVYLQGAANESYVDKLSVYKKRNMSNERPVVLIFRDDFDRVANWVLTYPDRETGGQMFGLWTHDRKPYINIIIGPGQNCSHGTHSFHQDIDYLKHVGTFLNTEFMMCHIGEWHSHHRLRLRQPSSGDLNSIWKHFPAGVEHFLLIIATIEDDHVRLNPWLFTASTHTYDAIEVKIMQKDNVFMRDDIVSNRISEGAEKTMLPQPRNTSQALNGKSVEQQNEGRWFLTDRGAYIVQFLNSKLEKIIDQSSSIEKTFTQGGLTFSFRRKTCRVAITFPQDFPNSAVKIVCNTPGAAGPLEWTIGHTEHISVEIVDPIVQSIKDVVPTVRT